MIIDKYYEIDSCDDYELGLKRKCKLEYKISYDDTKKPEAIIFMVGGWGSTKNVKFWDFDRQYVARKFKALAVQVYHHGIHRRKSDKQEYSAYTKIEGEDLNVVRKYCFNLGFNDAQVNEENALFWVDRLALKMQELKETKKISAEDMLYFGASLIPARDEYDNLGLMSAMDYIYALKHLLSSGGGDLENLPKIFIGGSYGGYLALLIAKIAPWHVDVVMDNSGSAVPLVDFLLGRETNTPDTYFNHPHYTVCLFTKTLWNRMDLNSPYYFKDENFIIRSILNPTHLILQKQKNPNTLFISYHSIKDELNPAKDKEKLYEVLQKLEFDAKLHLIRDESQVDKKTIKTLSHGLRMSDKAFLSKEWSFIQERLRAKKFTIKQDSISYPCKNRVFTFKDEGSKFKLKIT